MGVDRLILRRKPIPVDRAGLAQFDHARIDFARMLSGAFDARRDARQCLQSRCGDGLSAQAAQLTLRFCLIAHNHLGQAILGATGVPILHDSRT